MNYENIFRINEDVRFLVIVKIVEIEIMKYFYPTSVDVFKWNTFETAFNSCLKRINF
jgi:hypothetical protein